MRVFVGDDALGVPEPKVTVFTHTTLFLALLYISENDSFRH